MLKEWSVHKYYALESFFFFLVAEKVVALVIAYDGEFKWNIVKKFYVLKVFFFFLACVYAQVCGMACLQKKKLWEMILLFNGFRDGKLLVQKKYVQCTSSWTIPKATTW